MKFSSTFIAVKHVCCLYIVEQYQIALHLDPQVLLNKVMFHYDFISDRPCTHADNY